MPGPAEALLGLSGFRVLEHRHEIGLRRALGATGRHIAVQFLLEAAVLGVAGGVLGVLGGVAVTTTHSLARGAAPTLSAGPLVGGVVVAGLIAAVAGMYPARRAVRLAPGGAPRAGRGAPWWVTGEAGPSGGLVGQDHEASGHGLLFGTNVDEAGGAQQLGQLSFAHSFGCRDGQSEGQLCDAARRRQASMPS